MELEVKIDENDRMINDEELKEINTFGYKINKTMDYLNSYLFSFYNCFSELFIFFNDFYKYSMEIKYSDDDVDLFKEE